MLYFASAGFVEFFLFWFVCFQGFFVILIIITLVSLNQNLHQWKKSPPIPLLSLTLATWLFMT